MKKFYLSVLVVIVTIAGFSQDPHSSQFYSAPLHLNPAMTGVFRGNYRLTTLYRNQWGSVLKNESISNFRTMWGSVDFRLPLKSGWNKHNAIGVGINALNDKAADSEFGTTQVGLAFSYLQGLSRSGRQFLVIGLQGNFYQQTFTPNSLRLGHQWNGIEYDPSIPLNTDNSINYLNTNLMYFDAGVGLLWFMQGRDERTNAYVGVAGHHLNQPNIDLTDIGNDGTTANLNMKIVGHAGARLPIGRQFDLMPKTIFMHQGNNLEAVFGTDIRFNFDYYDLNSSSFRFGMLYRTVGGLKRESNTESKFGSEALILLTGFDYKGLNIGVAYDINLSEFREGTQSRGGFEVSLAYTGKFKQKQNYKTACPDF